MLPHLFPHGIAVYLIGGAFIGAGIAWLFLATGRHGGISSFYSAFWSYLITPRHFAQAALKDGRQWRMIYALGIVLGGLAYLRMGLPVEASQLAHWKFIVGGVLIGFGSRLGNGCTSGHGICGIASLSAGSTLMVITFLSTAIVTATLMARWG